MKELELKFTTNQSIVMTAHKRGLGFDVYVSTPQVKVFITIDGTPDMDYHYTTKSGKEIEGVTADTKTIFPDVTNEENFWISSVINLLRLSIY